MIRENQLLRSTPEAQGISSARILDFVNAVESSLHELHSFMLLRHGVVVAEGWISPYGPTYPHLMYSVSKSFASTAIGLAVAEGRLTVDDKVISFFPDDLPADVSDNLAAMQVRHLLTMATGHDKEVTDTVASRPDGDWTHGFLAQPVQHAPGSLFVYNTAATYMLSAILQKLTGITLLDYLRPRLFEPLGIENPTWETSPKGITVGGFGLSITTESLARFGQTYLQKGIWQGQRLIPEAWVEKATSYHTLDKDSQNIDWRQGYGYQFWRCRHNAYRADGAFGQFCIVMPEQDAVLALTSALVEAQPLLDCVWDYLLPGLNNPSPLPEDSAAHLALQQKSASLALLPPQGKDSSSLAATLSGKTYTLAANDQALEAITFTWSDSGNTVSICMANEDHYLPLELGQWKMGTYTLFTTARAISPKHQLMAVASSGTWIADDTFVVTIRYYETPFYWTLTCQFSDDQVKIKSEVNVSFTERIFNYTGRLNR